MASSESELAPGITSLPEALTLAIAWIDGGDVVPPAFNDSVGNSSDDNAPAPPPTDAITTSLQTPIEKAINLLGDLQRQVSRNGLFSKNEALDDVSTSSLELLGVEYQLGRAYLALPTYSPPPPPKFANGAANGSAANGSAANGSAANGSAANDGPSPSLLRKRNITRAIEYYHLFLKRLEQLGEDMLAEATLKEYHAMLDLEDMEDKKQSSRMNPSQTREMKIRRFQRKKATAQKQTQLQSQLERRSRLGVAEDEPMEGHDSESLSRTLSIETLRLHAEESLEEIQSSKGELEMLDMAIKMEGARIRGTDPRMNRNGSAGGMPIPQVGTRPVPNGNSNQPLLQMTQITHNPVTGQLEYTKQRVANGRLQPMQQIKREEIANGVFRPGWNQPTMTLAELGERERAEAIERAEAQKVAEAEAKFKPKRYEQLVRDGMEDDERLVEASAKLDRAWDDWKEENPRGSGNKMKERGDRNF